jgi:hypothetical protein
VSRVQLALAALARTELVGDVNDLQCLIAACNDIEQDLEADRRELGYRREKGVAPYHEKPAHGIAESCASDPVRNARGKSAHGKPIAVPITDIPTFNVTAADNDVGIGGGEGLVHLVKRVFVMLAIGIHDGHDRCRGRHDAFHTSRRQAPATEAMQAPYPWINLGNLSYGRSGAVGRAIIDKNNLPSDAGKRFGNRGDHIDDVVSFIERRHDDGQLGGGC